MVSIVALIDQKGKSLIQRAYRDDIPTSTLERFLPLVMEREEEGSYVNPCFTDQGISYLHIRHNNVYRESPSRSPGPRRRATRDLCSHF